MQVFKDRTKIIEGILEAADIVCTTMGPGGQKVLVKQEGVSTHTDGVTVARQLVGWYDRENPEKAAGVRMLLSAAEKTVTKAGDGTTTTCALVYGMLSAFEDGRFYRRDSFDLKQAAEDAIEKLKELSRMPTEEQLISVGVVSANNNVEIGTKIAEMVWKLGKDAYITNAYSKTSETYCEVLDGYLLEGGASSIELLHGRPEVTLNSPYVLIAEERIDDWKILHRALLPWLQEGQANGFFANPMVIIVGDLSETALTYVVQNNLKGIPLFAIRLNNERRIDILTDVSTFCGMDPHNGNGPKIFSKAHGTLAAFEGAHQYGKCQTLTISQRNAQFVPNEDSKVFIEAQAQNIRDLIEKADDKGWLETRLGKLKNSIGVVRIGGVTDIEKKYIIDVVDDCVRSCQAALEDGVVNGGGACLLTVASRFEEGWSLLDAGLRQPWDRILKNAGCGPEGADFALSVTNELLPYDVEKGEWDYSGKIIDSATSMIESIRNSVSLVCEVLETGVLIWK